MEEEFMTLFVEAYGDKSAYTKAKEYMDATPEDEWSFDMLVEDLRKTYRETWMNANPDTRYVLANVPSYMMLGDHDMIDNISMWAHWPSFGELGKDFFYPNTPGEPSSLSFYMNRYPTERDSRRNIFFCRAAYMIALEYQYALRADVSDLVARVAANPRESVRDDNVLPYMHLEIGSNFGFYMLDTIVDITLNDQRDVDAQVCGLGFDFVEEIFFAGHEVRIAPAKRLHTDDGEVETGGTTKRLRVFPATGSIAQCGSREAPGRYGVGLSIALRVSWERFYFEVLMPSE